VEKVKKIFLGDKKCKKRSINKEQDIFPQIKKVFQKLSHSFWGKIMLLWVVKASY
jgi:hypothetical protein